MMGRYPLPLSQTDLHLHSSVSPCGEISPRGLAELCCQHGVTLAASIDHNAVSGTEEFIWRRAQLGVRTVSGVELDCMFGDQTLHLLGYGFHIADTSLLYALQEAQARQKAAGLQLLDAIEALGSCFDRERVLDLAGDGAVCAGLAHPGASQLDSALPDALVHLPFDSLESFGSCHTATQSASYQAKAQEMRWLVTGGSDLE